MGLDETGIGKSEIGVVGEFLKGEFAAKRVQEAGQDGHEGKETQSNYSEFDMEVLESLPFCIAKEVHCCESNTGNKNTPAKSERDRSRG